MGLDIGIISIKYLDMPKGWSYKFAWELALYASTDGYMHGDGNNWGAFTKQKVRRMLRELAFEKGLTQAEEKEVWAWVRSLPWQGHTIELHFNW